LDANLDQHQISAISEELILCNVLLISCLHEHHHSDLWITGTAW